jgi:hypothetical protein
VFEKMMVGRMFGQKKNEVKGGWRKMHNEELHNLYSSPNMIRMTYVLVALMCFD